MQFIHIKPLENSEAVLMGYIHEHALGRGGRIKRPAVLIFPGGGYADISEREMEPVALSFFAEGYQAFVLRYTVFHDHYTAPDMLPLREAAAAMAWIRTEYEAVDVIPEKIAVCGFSAGGHLAASLSVHFDSERLKAFMTSEIAAVGGLRPSASILAYPVISSKPLTRPKLHESYEMLLGDNIADAPYHNIESHVTAHTPPAFVWHTFDDELVALENTLLFVQAMYRQNVPVEYHVFHTGRHGMSMCTSEVGEPGAEHCAHWFKLCTEWLGSLFEWEK